MSAGLLLAFAAAPGLTAAASPLAAPGPSAAPVRAAADVADVAAAAREARFLELLRSYGARPPAQSLAVAARLVDEGEFAGRPRAEQWIASASLSLGDPAAARAWFARLGRDHPESPWGERAQLGLGDAAAAERCYGEALARHAAAATGKDPAVLELARSRGAQIRLLRARQRAAWAAAAVAVGVALWWIASTLRHRPVALLPLPGELRLAGPVLSLLSLAALAQEPTPRGAVLQLCVAGAALLALSGWRLRAAAPRAWGRALHALAALGALSASTYAVLERGDLLGSLEETLRAGPG